MKKVIFVNSHPIQYFAPMYKYINSHEIDVEVWYASKNVLSGVIDKEFGVNVNWDIPLLDGYPYRFFKNNSWKASYSNGFWGLINISMITEIFRIKKSIIIVHGWHYLTHFIIILIAKLKGHTVCIRSDSPLNHEILKKGFKQKIKRLGLRYILFPRINYFLFIGNQNRLFYKSFNISDNSLIYLPYAVDNDRFSVERYNVPHIKAELNIPNTDKVILYSGKYISKKNPLDLIRAFHLLNEKKCWLIMVGDGKLRSEMEDFVKINQLKNVLLTGFINQSLITKYYASSDVFVMCSSIGETWGLSVNEAMSFDKPVILSDLTGCSDDLVLDGANGYVFKTGNIEDLTDKLKQVLIEKNLSWNVTSKEIIKKCSYETIVNSLKTILEAENS